MKKSLLLHAMSVHDRMLEPAEPPLLGQVWGYAKAGTSREMFVGHCLTVLSHLGMNAADIGWDKNIMAFDAQSRKGVTWSVLISLEDDSLASESYYFLGLWRRPGEKLSFGELAAEARLLDVGTDPELLHPAFGFGVLVADRPLARQEVGRLLDLGQGEAPFGQHLLQQRYQLLGNGLFTESASARFLLMPMTRSERQGRGEVRHLLYSLRNLMALMSEAVQTHQQMWSEDAERQLSEELIAHTQLIGQVRIVANDWDGLARDGGSLLLRGEKLVAERSIQLDRLLGLHQLFHAIAREIHAAELPFLAPLLPRMQMPFSHAEEQCRQRLDRLAHCNRQAGAFMQLLHARLLAALLERG